MKKRLLCMLLSLAMIFTILPSTAIAVDETSGSCGQNATWSFNESSGWLTISGSGKMDDYDYSWDSTSPWSRYLDQITTVSISEGITSVGSGAFGGEMMSNICPNLQYVFLPSTLEIIGVYAFAGSAIETISLPTSLKQIDAYAFAYTDLTSVYIPENVQSLGSYPAMGSIEDPFSGSPLETITVADSNRYFTAENNVLYDKGKTEIICYPQENSLTNYRIPDTVTETLYISDFCDISNLESITIPASVTLTAHEGATPPDGMMDSDETLVLYFEGVVPEITSDWYFYRDGYLLGIEAKKQSSSPSIESLYPVNGTVDYDGDVFQITFDRQIANIDSDEYIADVNLTSSGAFSIYRAADDVLVYKPSQYATSDFGIAYTPEKSTLSIRPVNLSTLLAPGTEYYITMEAGFVNFVDGTTNPAIQKGDWTFTTSGEPEPVNQLSFSISRSSMTVVAGNTATQRVTLYPADAAVTWSSSNANVARVDGSGIVTGVQPGTATITGTATYEGQRKTVAYTLQVTPSLSLAFTNKAVNLNVGDTESLGFTIRPVGPVVDAVSSNSSVIEIERASTSGNGTGIVSIRAVGAGTATLTISASLHGDTVIDTCTVVVEDNGQAVAQRFVDEALAQV